MEKVDRMQKGNNLTCVLKQIRAMKETGRKWTMQVDKRRKGTG